MLLRKWINLLPPRMLNQRKKKRSTINQRVSIINLRKNIQVRNTQRGKSTWTWLKKKLLTVQVKSQKSIITRRKRNTERSMIKKIQNPNINGLQMKFQMLLKLTLKESRRKLMMYKNKVKTKFKLIHRLIKVIWKDSLRNQILSSSLNSQETRKWKRKKTKIKRLIKSSKTWKINLSI